jgi:hypothetical protein
MWIKKGDQRVKFLQRITKNETATRILSLFIGFWLTYALLALAEEMWVLALLALIYFSMLLFKSTRKIGIYLFIGAILFIVVFVILFFTASFMF